MKAQNDYSWANEYVGLPFKPLGRTEDGLDCYGLTRLVYLEQLGIELPMMLDKYKGTHERNHDEMKQALLEESQNMDRWLPVIQGQETSYDILILNVAAMPLHVGLVVKKNAMLHIRTGENATIVDYRKGEWRLNKPVGIFRHKDLCNN